MKQRLFNRLYGTCQEETTSTCKDNQHHNQRTLRNRWRLIMSQDDEISVHDQAREQNVQVMIPQNEELMREKLAPPQPPADPPSQPLNSQSPIFIVFPSPPSYNGTRADTSRPVLQRDEESRKRFMSEDQPSSAAVKSCGTFGDKHENGTSAPGEHPATTETRSGCQGRISKIRQCRSRGRLRLPISRRAPVAPLFSERSCRGGSSTVG